ncbi:hypothetical protein [Clavibacter michiganensis]|uniref:hypothetical protein n=1 Tax=Clavibacter michiganensis TaxID=28447 RepID=UPI001AEA4D5D|nr:hypothetical protein [Clavibacter michiganensis]MBP2456874.1 hypothetical protein [Clavibacter michiganensis]MDQ0409444.1 hypothetical protein [Clavibacter michiganensis]
MSALTLRIDPAASTTHAHAAVATLASLPESFRRTDDAGDVVVVAGGDGWAGRATEAARAGARALLVLDPGPAADADLAALADAGTPVVLDVPWRHDEAVRRVAPRIHRLAAPGALFEARATVASTDDLDGAARALALTTQALVGSPLTELAPLARTPDHLMLTGRTASGVIVVVSAVVTAHAHACATFRLVVGDRAAHVTLPAPGTAAPGRASVTDAAGREDLPVVFESGHRTAMRLARDAAHGRCVPDDVADLRALLVAAPALADDARP